jgi:probable rRNA maturation factor
MIKTNREVSIFNEIDAFSFDEREIISLFSALDSSKFKIPDGELSIAFLSKGKMRRIHRKFLGDSALTDVITFPGDSAMSFAGEICISPDYALSSHRAHGTTFSEELSLYLVHGYLHIFGLNDILEWEIKKMREGENFCLSLLKQQKLLPKFFYEHL